jgi:hypothetical protein
MAATAQVPQRGLAGRGIAEAGRQFRPRLTGRGMLARYQSGGALEGGLTQSLGNQCHDALRSRASHAAHPPVTVKPTIEGGQETSTDLAVKADGRTLTQEQC